MRRLVLLALVALIIQGCGKSSSKKTDTSFFPFLAFGIRQPPVKAAADVSLPDDTPVVGVVVDGKPRAYVLDAMSQPDRHIVNDVINGVPVTVTYCDQVPCVRVLTGRVRDRPLDIDQAGRDADGLILLYRNKMYSQGTGKPALGHDGLDLPFVDLEYQRTTWEDWHEMYPETEVYIGPLKRSPPQGSTNS